MDRRINGGHYRQEFIGFCQDSLADSMHGRSRRSNSPQTPSQEQQCAEKFPDAPVNVEPHRADTPEVPHRQNLRTTSSYNESLNYRTSVRTSQTLSRVRLASKALKDTEIIARMQRHVLETKQSKNLDFPVQYRTIRYLAMINQTYNVPPSKSRSRRETDRNTGSPNLKINEMKLKNRDITKTCNRCNLTCCTEYLKNCNLYSWEKKCTYHSGELQTSEGEQRWTCCQNDADSKGCEVAGAHVWCDPLPAINGPRWWYVQTRPSEVLQNHPSVYAIDCEAVYTTFGLEIAKVTVVDIDGVIVYDTYVIPESPVVDYNTQFSGITAEHIQSARTVISDVQEHLMGFIFSDTILIGHGIRDYLRLLRLTHDNVIDTSICYHYSNGLPYGSSLQTLVKKILGREIQTEADDSYVNAQASMDLMLYRITIDALNDVAIFSGRDP